MTTAEYHRDYYAKNRSNRKTQIRANSLKTKKRNRENLREHLSDKCCADCGLNDWRVLAFDHVRGVKRTDVSNMIIRGFSWKSIKEEIDKCDIVCANCHLLRTSERGAWWRSAVEA